MIKAIVDGDLVTAIATGDAVQGIPVPMALQSFPIERLRHDGAAIIDAASNRKFWIDAHGRKHIVQTDPSWQLLACAWDDDIEMVAGKWQVVSPVRKARAAKLAQLATDYQSALEAGVQYQGAKFDSDDHSQTEVARVLTAVANGWTLPAGFAWVDAANQPHPVPDVAWLQGLAQAMADHKAALFARLQVAKAAVRKAATVADVRNVVL